jgi:type VI secretion system protein ImpK
VKQDDPFEQLPPDRTFIAPMPAARTNRAVAVAPAGAAPATAEANEVVAPSAAAALNPLVAAAIPLLNVVNQIQTSAQANPAQLRDALARGIQAFEATATRQNIAPQQILAARYALCTFLDEAAANTPWGGSGVWAKQSLLVMFHKEAWGGEKLFQLLGKLAEKPEANRDLLELLYLCLALGFEGRYRVVDQGRTQLDQLRERLAQILRTERGEFERELSPQWHGSGAVSAQLRQRLPLWVAAACGSVLLAIIYFGFSYALNTESDRTFAAIESLRAPLTAAPPASISAPAPLRLATRLHSDIEGGLIEVQDLADRSVVILHGDGLFESGSATLKTAVLPLLQRIAVALQQTPGQVLVSGHTDSQPIHTLRFPSNYDLSQARASAVVQLLAGVVAPARMRAEGHADSEPIGANSTVEGRARNRRVEITLFPSASTLTTPAAASAGSVTTAAEKHS